MAGTSYTRQSSLTDGDTITAALFNDEYNQLVNAFAYSSSGLTGHQHDGGPGEGGNIEIIGDQDFKNKIVVDSTNNRWSVYVEVGGTAVEQVRIEDGVVYPVTDSDVDLGTDAARFKAAYIDSITATTSLTLGTSITVSSILDEDDMVSNSATALATQQSIKAYVDAQVTAQDLDLTDGTTSISIDLDSEALSVLGGTGITSTASGNGVTLAIDSTVTTLTGTQTLTNKTLTSPDVNGGTIDGTVIGGTTAAAGSFTNIIVGGTVDGRDVATDGAKLDGIEALADVTDTTNVTAAGALMDSEVTNLAQVKAFDSSDYATAAQGATADAALPKAGGAMTGAITTNSTFDGRDVATDGTKLDGIEALADVTDTANVTAAGALMDSELTNITAVKALNQGVATTDSPSFVGLTASGEITANGGIALGDNDKATFGAGDDLQIYHDGSNSYIEDTGAGVLFIKGTGGVYLRGKDSDEDLGRFLENGAVDLYYNGSSKLATTSTGIDVTGTATMDGLTVDGRGSISQGMTNGSISAFTDPHLALKSTDSVDTTGFVGMSFATSDTANYGFSLGSQRTSGGQGDLVVRNHFNSAQGTKKLSVADNGDISFYEDTGTTAKLFWDASAESLGIGTTSPSEKLELTGWLKVGSGANEVGGVIFPYSTSSGSSRSYAWRNDVSAYGDFSLLVSDTQTGDVKNGTKVISVRNNNVGIGTSSPSNTYGTNLHVHSTATSSAIKLTNSSTGTGGSDGFELFGSGVNTYLLNREAGFMYFGTSNTEAMRIDSSGNVLVGKTASGFSTDGIELANGGTAGKVQITRTSNAALFLNRRSSDGDIVNFLKDGTPVGSIRSISGDSIGIGTGDAGLRFVPWSNKITPIDMDNGLNSDGLTTLGDTNKRFKDLYLAGGVYLGGTGAANKLEDYEEGTWSPIFADASTGGNVATVGSRLGTYTKVGNLVTVGCNLSDIDITGLTSSNAIYIRGLPFTVGSTQIRSGSAFLDRVTFSGYVTAYATGSHVLLFNTATGASDAALLVSSINSTGSDVFFTLQYQV